MSTHISEVDIGGGGALRGRPGNETSVYSLVVLWFYMLHVV